MDTRKIISQSHGGYARSRLRATYGFETGPCCIGATFMAPTWDCKTRFWAFAVPLQGHYSMYQVGLARCL